MSSTGTAPANDEPGATLPEEPFPAEAALAAVAAVPLGPLGRFALACGEGGPLLLDTTDGRTWRLGGEGAAARWTPVAFDVGVPPAAP